MKDDVKKAEDELEEAEAKNDADIDAEEAENAVAEAE